ncbi:TPA: PIN domain-containing protein [Candidatus Poribacteria bacterium]|nr:PIN domain-containing protein [Candidatus Poribacteria bacterium]
MFLIDTNVWLELLLMQEKADEVHKFFMNIDADLLAITDFSLYSIGIILTRLKKDELFRSFISDTIEDSNVRIVRLNTNDLKYLTTICHKYQFDFDDAYQYVASEKHELIFVSFDGDFDRTDRKRRTPLEALKDLA